MKLSELHQAPSSAPIYAKAGRDIIKKIYGKNARFVKTVSGRYSKQPWYEIKDGSNK